MQTDSAEIVTKITSIDFLVINRSVCTDKVAPIWKLNLLQESGRCRFHIEKCKTLLLRIALDRKFITCFEKRNFD